MTLRVLVSLCCIAAVVAVSAQPLVPSEFIPPATLQPRDAAGVPCLSGGIADDERQQMLAQERRFPLRLMFSVPSGAPAVADEVTISGPKGVVFSARDAGPWLMLALPPGSYTAKVSFNGVVRQRALKVGSGVQKVHWTAPAPPA